MLYAALIFFGLSILLLLVALVAGSLGLGIIAATSFALAKLLWLLCPVFLALAGILYLVRNARNHRRA